MIGSVAEILEMEFTKMLEHNVQFKSANAAESISL